MNRNELIQKLQDVHFLSEIGPRHLEQLAEMAEVCDFDAHQVIFREGEPAECVYLVVSGNVSLQVCAENTGSKHIVDVGPGELLGWSSLTCHRRFAATAVALTRTQMIRIDAERLQAICDEDPEFGYEFMRRAMLALAKRLTATWEQLAELYLTHYVPISACGTGHND
jgi:CRP-like cAMP-binding protein